MMGSKPEQLECYKGLFFATFDPEAPPEHHDARPHRWQMVDAGVAVPLDDTIKGQVPAALVVLKQGNNVVAPELIAFCLRDGPAYAHPRLICIVEQLPLLGSGTR